MLNDNLSELMEKKAKETNLNISEWPELERPREKLLHRGAESLSDAELLAIFLRTGVNGQSAVDLARNLLLQFDNLKSLLEASEEEVCKIPGMGTVKYIQLHAGLELGKRYLKAGIQRLNSLNNPKQTQDYLSLKLKSYPYEVFGCLFLDNKNRVIEFKELFRGTINGATVHCREVVKEALALNSAAVIFAHNHPSGVSEPSQADIDITKRLKKSLELIDIRVLDHIIVGDNHCESLAELGLF